MLQQMYPQVHHDYNYELNKDMNFAAAHLVPHEGAGACQYMHGHTYFVNITVAGDQLDEQGFLTNFSALKKLVHGRYDHSVMNDQDEFTRDFDASSLEFPTTENVARTIYEIVDKHLADEGNDAWCLQVFVRETPTSSITYRPKKKKQPPIEINLGQMEGSAVEALEKAMQKIGDKPSKLQSFKAGITRLTTKQYSKLMAYGVEVAKQEAAEAVAEAQEEGLVYAKY